MPKRYIGEAVIDIRHVDDDEFAGTITVPLADGRKLSAKFQGLHVPAYLKRDLTGTAEDLYDRMAVAAVERAISTPGRKSPQGVDPAEVLLEAIADAVDDEGNWAVERERGDVGPDGRYLNPCGGRR